MKKNIWVFVVGFVLILIFLLLKQALIDFLLIGLLYLYYELTLSPKEREKRRIKRKEKEAEKKRLKTIEKEEYYKHKGRERAKDEGYGERRSRDSISSGDMDKLFGRGRNRRGRW